MDPPRIFEAPLDAISDIVVSEFKIPNTVNAVFCVTVTTVPTPTI